MSNSIKNIQELGFPWKTPDPFLFCAFHNDHFPKGNASMGPEASLKGRNIGQDFSGKDGWSMYHGSSVPGFPSHPHRGFETVTIAEKGLVDHSDSMGAAGRFGNGDVQWMTAGKGVQHSEMFPLLKEDAENPLLLFQIWLNLPRQKKLVEPHFKMLWHEDIPVIEKASAGSTARVKLVTGKFGDDKALTPAPDSWAADPDNEVAIWMITMEPKSELRLPTASAGINRSLFYYQGDEVTVDGETVNAKSIIELDPELETNLENGNAESHFLFLQGRPLNEPVAQYGPFVMNHQHEIQQAVREFQETQFGGWPWDESEQVHDKDSGRFALHADGKREEK